eukprot:g30858.t1
MVSDIENIPQLTINESEIGVNQEVLSVNMASRQQILGMTEEAICPICLDFFTDPVSLQCGHNFCRSCIPHSLEKEGINFCPQCRQEFPEVNLSVNWALVNLSEKAQKLKLKPQKKGSKPLCDEHHEELKLFCQTEKKLVCYTCRDSREHRQHSFQPINEAVEIYEDQLKTSLDLLEKQKSLTRKAEQKQKQNISDVK